MRLEGKTAPHALPNNNIVVFSLSEPGGVILLYCNQSQVKEKLRWSRQQSGRAFFYFGVFGDGLGRRGCHGQVGPAGRVVGRALFAFHGPLALALYARRRKAHRPAPHRSVEMVHRVHEGGVLRIRVAEEMALAGRLGPELLQRDPRLFVGRAVAVDES